LESVLSHADRYTIRVICPKCAFEQDDATLECGRCGIVFSRWQDARDEELLRQARIRSPLAAFRPPTDDEPTGLTKKHLVILGGSLGAAIVASLLPFVSFVLSAFVTLFHELSHAIAAWLMAQPAIPAFDFVYGGGFTHFKDFQFPLAIFIGAGWTWLGWTFRRNRKSLVVVGVSAGLWLLAISGEWRRELVIAIAGHAGEFIFAGIFFWMVLANVGWREPKIERPVGAFIAFFVQIHSMEFAWRLAHDRDFLSWYLQGKGGALMNDLEIVALDLNIYLGINPGVPRVAMWLFAFSVVPLALALALYLQKDRVTRFVAGLLET